MRSNATEELRRKTTDSFLNDLTDGMREKQPDLCRAAILHAAKAAGGILIAKSGERLPFGNRSAQIAKNYLL